jgi:hypothetical protein
MGRARRVWFLTVLFFGIVIAACDNTPTVPLPPPEMVSVTAPADGYAEVMGEPGSVEDDALVIILNEETQKGVTEEADTDGSFYAVVKAQPKNILSIRQAVDHKISSPTFFTVPEE